MGPHPGFMTGILNGVNAKLREMGEAEILLDLACGAYAAGHVSRGVAARMAGLDRLAFDQILVARRIPSYDEERLAEDRETLRSLAGK